ncbi:MAG TPA: transporter substrate-binding domain-containing protein [Pusillimonas sp.]|uniref:transporter substrate-binding domain-containing protein n=1 Tax=Pusillimonas sp. TaxID=3040095 RepID=UPI002C6C0357|nr:transporter substrate-binding domain-containing protein [Pusillimonas sp.]HUH87248.1 transporter substrate-binding domain-containing protein [Pusillimonas sp.]
MSRAQALHTRIAAAILALVLGFSQQALTAQSQPASVDTNALLRVGVAYVPPPFVGGAKVRTPERTTSLLITDLGKTLGRVPRLIQSNATSASVPPGLVDIAVAELASDQVQAADDGWTAIATGHETRPMAVMRTDTDIKSWSGLKGRTVCFSEDGRYRGRIAQRYGAVERVYRAPADSLLALRIGECDAAVHDDTMLNALLRFPEWQKFSARLVLNETTQQYLMIPADNQALVAAVQQAADQWKKENYLNKLVADMARDIAFEVYLDQTVPDCH